MAPTAATKAPAAGAATSAGGSNVMGLYWELASVDPAIRLQAAESLITALYNFQEEHNAATASDEPAADINLDLICAQDVSYGIKRLLRGLPSSRDGARQGFAVALAELLQSLHFLDTKTVLTMLNKLTQTEGAKGQEEREVLFGRIFGMMAICQAGMLSRDSTTQEDLKSMTTNLLRYASAKSYLRESCFRVILCMVDSVKDTPLAADFIQFVVPTVVEKEIENPEDLWFAITTQSRYPEIEWSKILPSWKHAQILHRKNQTQLIEILKQSTSVSPRVHSVWDSLFDAMLNSEVALPKHSITLRDLWTNLDEALYSSTHERKHLGLQLFQRLLARVDTADVPFLFTPQLLRTLINNLAKHDNYLHKIAKQTANVVSKLAAERKDIALQLVLQLVGKNGHQRFDAITKTKTVESILGSMVGSDVLAYVQYLQELFVNVTGEGAEVDSQRQWVVDQLNSLLKNGRIPKEQKWIQSVAHFVCLHAFYDVKVADAKNDLIRPAQPPVSEATRAVCKERFFAILGTLATIVLKDTAGKPLHAGLMQNGHIWGRDVHAFMLELSANKKTVAAHDLDAESAAAIAQTSKIIAQIHKETAKLDQVKNRDALAQYRAFELLFVHVLLQVYAEPEEAVGVLEEIENCYTLFFKPKEQKKKRKAADSDDDNDEEHEPIEVLVDVLISFLAKPSAPLRTLSQEVFKVFCTQLTKKALDLIFDVLSTKGGVAGASELFDVEDNDTAMDVDGEEGDEEEDDEGDEEEEDSEDDDSDDDDDDDEDANAAMDEELRLKIKEAMGKAAVDDDGDSEEEDFVDDDEMGAFDDKLAEIFRQRKEIKAAKKDLKQQVLHFKHRVVDLLEIFIRKASANPLIIELIMPLMKLITTTARSADDQALHVKLEALVKNKLLKIKDVPTEPHLDADRAVSILKEVHEYARKASDGSTVALCSSASLLLVRILSHCREPVALNDATPKKSPKKQKVGGDQTKVISPPKTQIATVYLTSLKDFMTAPKSRIKPVLFLDLVTRYPNFVWELLPDLVALAASETVKPYPLVQAHAIVVRLIKQMPKADEADKSPVLKRVFPAFIDNVIAILFASASTEEAEKDVRALNKERVKELVRDLLVLVRRMSKLFDKNELVALWKVEELQTALDAVCASEKFMSMPSLPKATEALIKAIKTGGKSPAAAVADP
ncbi:hypothetical protein HDU86_003758 [Geranomyces michiganensis]|nr:hypothetical protein HDU86_003758 [Geranomyces michiganensis]